MSCRGYDPKAISLPKTIKRRAATILDNHKRGEFIKSWVQVVQEQRNTSKRTKE